MDLTRFRKWQENKLSTQVEEAALDDMSESMEVDTARATGDRPPVADGSSSSQPSSTHGSAGSNDPPEAAETTVNNKSKSGKDDIARKRRVLLDKITLFEKRGAILPSDAHTLRFQVHETTSGSWTAVEKRMEKLAFSWNPYQDYSADERRQQEQDQKQQHDHEQTNSSTKRSTRHHGAVPNKKQKKDFYSLLQLSDRDATGEEIKKQFHKLALQLHPDKQQQQQAAGAAAVASEEEEAVFVPDSTEFARLRVAYETLSDPEQRAAYDLKLQEAESGIAAAQERFAAGLDVKDQITLEATTDYASLEWMARVKHKMDVMDRLAEWAKLLDIRATELRFETGEECIGNRCGKIVTMDRDLECYGSPRRRVCVFAAQVRPRM